MDLASLLRPEVSPTACLSDQDVGYRPFPDEQVQPQWDRLVRSLDQISADKRLARHRRDFLKLLVPFVVLERIPDP